MLRPYVGLHAGKKSLRMNRWFSAKMLWLTCAMGMALSTVAQAQQVLRRTEHLDSDHPEAWAMNYFTSVALFTGLGVPRARDPGSLELGLEVDWMPKLSKSMKRVGFNGLKEEDLNKAPVLIRPRLTIGLPWQFALSFSYLPSVTVFGVTPDLFAFALERPVYEGPFFTLGARAYGQIGNVKGAFTCPGEVAHFPPGSAHNPFGCERKSSDKATQRYGGLEVSASYRFARLPGVEPYLSFAGNFLDNEFHVHALTFGNKDRTRLVNETWTFSASAGVVYALTERMNLSLGVFYTPLWVTRPPETYSESNSLFNVRSMITYRFF